METSILSIGIVKKGNSVLLRKKPKELSQYKQTWYLFGARVDGDNTNYEKVLKGIVKQQAGINIEISERLPWYVEVKKNTEGEQRFYVYLHSLCKYKSGKLTPGEGVEKLEWVPIKDLKKYDIVPQSRRLFEEIGYL